jgi:signal transduction histidine kinase
MTTRGLLRAAGLVMWGFAGIPAALSIAYKPGHIGSVPVVVWVGAFVVFGVTFFRATRADAPDGRDATRSLAIQTLSALGMNTLLCTGFEAALLVVVAVQLGLMMPLARALPWLVVQSVMVVLLAGYHMGWPGGAYWSIAVIGFEAFAFTIAAMAGRETAARRALEKTNAELEATRESLALASRDAERLRIARELHDLLGHDLIALHLELETARHLVDGKAKVPVDRAHEVAKGLLASVRKAVSSLREDTEPVDVAAGVRALVEKVHEPRVHLEAPESLEIGDAERANAVVRCVQEIVTNAMKHAHASNLWIAIVPRGGSVELTARDDGRGTRGLKPGNGLAGMRERLERLGGELVLETDEGEGFRVRAKLPIANGAKGASA